VARVAIETLRQARSLCDPVSATAVSAQHEALSYARLGWRVVPLISGTKHPATGHGWHDATSDAARIRRWSWTGGVAIACEASGLLALDIDSRHGGDEELHDLERRLGALPQTVSCVTGGGGAHFYFQLPAVRVRSSLGPGVEIKTRGYVIAPPTVHAETGRRYEWDAFPGEVDVARLPARWLVAMREKPRRRARRPFVPRGDLGALQTIPSAEYVPALTGRNVDRRGFVQCPFHAGGQERTPSLHVDSDTGQWYCHAPACQTGGGLLGFYARLTGRQVPRDPDGFREFVRDVAGTLLGKAQA
jgi:hypothetical protein